MIDINKIVLTDLEVNELKRFDKGRLIKTDNCDFGRLSGFGLITRKMVDVPEKRCWAWDGEHYEITGYGQAYLDMHKRKKREKKISEIRNWITTVIAVAAFILSVISLILQAKK